MKVTQASAADFVAHGYEIALRIKPYRSRRSFANAEYVAEYGYRGYTFIQRKRVLQRKRMDSRRYIIYGSGYYRGKKVNRGVFGVTGTTGKRAVFVRVWWYANGKYANFKRNLSYKIARSVYFHR